MKKSSIPNLDWDLDNLEFIKQDLGDQRSKLDLQIIDFLLQWYL
jgi:hypothetical protein